MPHLIEIGTGPQGPVHMDVHLMLRQGLYVQANSGGGKSWLLRRLAEQLCPIVPTFVVDVEGEFSSLRERFPFFLVAKEGGDALADPRTAGALARKLLELRASAVFDIFGLDLEERHAWMKGFLHGLDQAPRDVWGDTAILIDEAHVFAPEKGKGESIALGGMAALATRGRKRGFGPVDATQRGAKFNKDVQSELKNAAVGLNTWEIDRERAREALGVGRRERDEYDKALRSMEAGEFFLVGRAFGTFDPVRVKVGPVHSTHPEPGQTKHLAAPPPPAKIRAMLAKLGDLPKEETESDDPRALRAELAKLREQLRGAPAGDLAGSAEVDRLRLELRDIKVARQADAAALNAYADRERMLSKTLGVLESAFEAWTGRAVNLSRPFPVEHERPLVDAGEPPWGGVQWPAPETVTFHRQPDGSTTREINTPPRTFFLNETHEHPRPAPRPRAPAGDPDLPVACRRILTALAQCGPRLTRRKLSILTGYPPGGSSLRNNFSKLRLHGQISDVGEDVVITDLGRTALGAYDPLPTGRALIDYWMRELPEAAAKILTVVVGAYPAPVTRAKLAHVTGYPPGGSSIRNNLSKLRGLELVVDVGDDIKAADELFGGA